MTHGYVFKAIHQVPILKNVLIKMKSHTFDLKSYKMYK